MTPFLRFGPILLLCILLVGCGGSTSSPMNNPTPPTPSPSSSGSGTSPAGKPNVVNVSQGQTLTGVDVTVSAPAGSPSPNAENLGVNNVTGRASAAKIGRAHV